MAITARKLADGSVVYWVSFRWHRKQVWERAGKDRRAAERLDARRKSEVAKGSYTPDGSNGSTTVAQWAAQWLDARRTRNADDDRVALERYVISLPWFAELKLVDVKDYHAQRVVDDLREVTWKRHETDAPKPLSEKSIANIYGIARTMMAAAKKRGLVDHETFAIGRKVIDRRGGQRREPYAPAEVERLIASPAIPMDRRMWNALAFFTGMREGEVCGRRWADWDRTVPILGALAVASQYDAKPLKTEERIGQQSRIVPVHPRLAEMLDAWWSDGFERCYCRKPTPEDFIVPRRERGHEDALFNHTKSSAYKAWVRSCVLADVPNRTLHATRHTFITFCRRGGATGEVVEKITHNARGAVIDTYTHFDWKPLCEAVLAFSASGGPYLPGGVDARVDQIAELTSGNGGGAGNRTGDIHRNPSQSIATGHSGHLARHTGKQATSSTLDAVVDAPQHRRGVGPALHAAKDAALAGDERTTHAHMHRAARLLGLAKSAQGAR